MHILSSTVYNGFHMIDPNLIEEIVNKVMARLMQDPAFVAASKAGYFQSTPGAAAPWATQPTAAPITQNLPSAQSSFVSPLPFLQAPPPAPAKPVNAGVVEHHGRVLSEWDVLQVHRSGKRAVSVTRGAIITPLAKDRARDLCVDIITA